MVEENGDEAMAVRQLPGSVAGRNCKFALELKKENVEGR